MTSIIRKGPFSRAEFCEETDDGDFIDWIAEARRNTGVWVIRQPAVGSEDEMSISGQMFEFTEDTEPDQLLVMTPDEREAMGMSDKAYQRLNILLALNDEGRK